MRKMKPPAVSCEALRDGEVLCNDRHRALTCEHDGEERHLDEADCLSRHVPQDDRFTSSRWDRQPNDGLFMRKTQACNQHTHTELQISRCHGRMSMDLVAAVFAGTPTQPNPLDSFHASRTKTFLELRGSCGEAAEEGGDRGGTIGLQCWQCSGPRVVREASDDTFQAGMNFFF